MNKCRCRDEIIIFLEYFLGNLKMNSEGTRWMRRDIKGYIIIGTSRSGYIE
jgi:hypothetical protein